MLLDNSAWEKIGDVLSSSDFYKSEHRIIFESIVRLIDENKPADVVTVYQSLKSQGVDEQCGELHISIGLLRHPGVAHAVQYARIVRDQSILRSLLTASEDIAQMALIREQKLLA